MEFDPAHARWTQFRRSGHNDHLQVQSEEALVSARPARRRRAAAARDRLVGIWPTGREGIVVKGVVAEIACEGAGAATMKDGFTGVRTSGARVA